MSDVNSKSTLGADTLPKEIIEPISADLADKKIKPTIDGLGAYLIHALENPTKKLDTRDSLISKLAKNPKLTEESVKQLIFLEKNKNFFISFRNLLRFSDLIVGFPFLKDSLKCYLKESLCRNEIIIKLGLEASILNIENAISLNECFKKVKLLSPDDLSEEYFKKIKPKDWQNYRAILTLVLAEWYANTRGLTSVQLVDLLNTSVWSSALKDKDPNVLVKNLLESTDFDLIASAISFYQQKSIDANARLLKSENQLMQLSAVNQELERLLSDKDFLITKLESNLTELNSSHVDALVAQQLENQTLSINLKNQLEDLRVRNLRLLQSSVELLGDGLIAINRSEPKVNVMKDHAQRVLDGLNSELERLKEFGK
jgi:hypothetical protein